MNRIDRLFGLIVLLQARRRVRAEEMATSFEVSRRTIYRDMQALSEAGVPIVSLPGIGYELAEGYFLPPLVFTVAEATALSLGARLLADQAAGRMAAGATGALAKIVACLTPETRAEMERMAETIGFLVPRWRFDLDDPRLVVIQRAIQARRVLRLRYRAYLHGEETTRAVEPSRLTYSDGVWYLHAYCRLREGTRQFRLGRIEALEETPETFESRDVPAAPPVPPAALVRVRVPRQLARWVRERQHYGFSGEEASDADSVVMTYRVDAVSELLPWLRGWGPAVEVLTPAAVRAALRDEARQLAALLAEDAPATLDVPAASPDPARG
jgi:predicted DNA-binding transcriptional regulator YafY